MGANLPNRHEAGLCVPSVLEGREITLEVLDLTMAIKRLISHNLRRPGGWAGAQGAEGRVVFVDICKDHPQTIRLFFPIKTFGWREGPLV